MIKKSVFQIILFCFFTTIVLALSFPDYKSRTIEILEKLYTGRMTFKQCKNYFQVFLKNNPIIALALKEYYTGLHYLDIRQRERAIPFFRKALKWFPDNVFIKNHLALILNQENANIQTRYQQEVLAFLVRGEYQSAFKNFEKWIHQYSDERQNNGINRFLVYKIQPEDMENSGLIRLRLYTAKNTLEKWNKHLKNHSYQTYQFVAFPYQENAFHFPCKGFISSLWGFRLNPFRAVPEFHAGIDIETQSGEHVVCIADGTIKSAHYSAGGGNTVFIKHENGYESRYFHGKRILVKAGQRVRKGQVIMIAGATGSGNSIHLHFEVYHNGMNKDPLSFYRLNK